MSNALRAAAAASLGDARNALAISRGMHPGTRWLADPLDTSRNVTCLYCGDDFECPTLGVLRRHAAACEPHETETHTR